MNVVHRTATALGTIAATWALAAPPEPPASAGGATAGYVDDKSCAICHGEIWKSYQEVGMARSFYRPSPEKSIEDFDDNHFFHVPSRRHYEMSFGDGRLVFKRYQVDPAGQRINVFERRVDWVVGSGNHSRVYLYQTPAGDLFQLPIAWYARTASWGMAPGFDRPDHEGVTRRVRRECMFCHNAYPQVPAGSDVRGAPQVFPHELPEGTGCQRCHGPAAEHVEIAETDMGNMARVRMSIVNPGRLPEQLRDDVCDQCHLQPSVALAGVRRFGRGDYSYQAGQPLARYLVATDVDMEGEERSERFEINHHPYRLRQSRCFEASGRLNCLTCHDPHRKVPSENRAAHFRAACLGCHEVDACQLPHSTPLDPPKGTLMAGENDCVACHMPKRRTHDVVRVVMTDHFIRRRPGGEELLAPREEEDPVLLDVELLDPRRAPEGDHGEIYRTVAVMRAGGTAAAVERLGKLLENVRSDDLEPYLDLALGQIQQHREEEAETTLLGILERAPGHLLAMERLAIARFRLGRPEEAAELLRRVVRDDPARAEAWFNLGRILSSTGESEEAVTALRRAVETGPNVAPAWFHLGNAYVRLERPDDAVASYRRALEIDPAHGPAYRALGQTLLDQGRRAEAARWLRHGEKVMKLAEP